MGESSNSVWKITPKVKIVSKDIIGMCFSCPNSLTNRVLKREKQVKKPFLKLQQKEVY
jgi:hypothetical protein